MVKFMLILQVKKSWMQDIDGQVCIVTQLIIIVLMIYVRKLVFYQHKVWQILLPIFLLNLLANGV